MLQAKSGTGKTVTFGIIILDALSAALAAPQALVVEPTREVALQVQRTIAALCKELPLQARGFRMRDVDAETEAHFCAVRGFRGRLAGACRYRAAPWQLMPGGCGHPWAATGTDSRWLVAG